MVSVGWLGEGACEKQRQAGPWISGHCGAGSPHTPRGRAPVAGWGLPAAQSPPFRPATEGLACLPLRPSAETGSPEVLGWGGAAGLVCGHFFSTWVGAKGLNF